MLYWRLSVSLCYQDILFIGRQDLVRVMMGVVGKIMEKTINEELLEFLKDKEIDFLKVQRRDYILLRLLFSDLVVFCKIIDEYLGYFIDEPGYTSIGTLFTDHACIELVPILMFYEIPFRKLREVQEYD